MHLSESFGKKIGIIGGGQLCKMLTVSANLLGFQVLCYTNEEESSGAIFAHQVFVGDYKDEAKLLEFAGQCDFLTIEFEAIGAKALQKIEKTYPGKLFPNSNAIFVSQNRLREKTFFYDAGVKVAEFAPIKTKEDALDFFQKHGKFILKTTEEGYDGKGQLLISCQKDIEGMLPFEGRELVAEQFIPFAFESSVILTRGKDGEIITFPIPVNIHKKGILHRSIVNHNHVPWKEKMEKMACKIAHELEFVGTMAVEFFILENGEILANEMAPRVHNSGHFSQDLCTISQFENHIRAIAGLPIHQPKLLFEGEMLNLIGEEINLSVNFLDKPNAKLHIYGKKEVKPNRKMGHINFIYDEIFS